MHHTVCLLKKPTCREYAMFASYLAPENGHVIIAGPPGYGFYVRINYCTSCSNNVTVYCGYYTFVLQNGSSLITRSHTSVFITAATRWTRKFTIEAPGKVPFSRSPSYSYNYFPPAHYLLSFSDQSSTPTFELYSIGRVIKNFEIT